MPHVDAICHRRTICFSSQIAGAFDVLCTRILQFCFNLSSTRQTKKRIICFLWFMKPVRNEWKDHRHVNTDNSITSQLFGGIQFENRIILNISDMNWWMFRHKSQTNKNHWINIAWCACFRLTFLSIPCGILIIQWQFLFHSLFWLKTFHFPFKSIWLFSRRLYLSTRNCWRL